MLIYTVLKMFRTKAHGPHHSPEKHFLPMNTFLQSYDYTIMLIKKEKKNIISRSGELKIVLDYQLDKIRTVIFSPTCILPDLSIILCLSFYDFLFPKKILTDAEIYKNNKVCV